MCFRLEGLGLEIVKEWQKFQKNDFPKKDHFNLIEFSGLDSRELRRRLFGIFKESEKNNLASLFFSTVDFQDYDRLKFFSKITAQEIFRYLKLRKNRKLKKITFLTGFASNFKVVEKNIIGYLRHLSCSRGPFLTVDGIVEYKGGIVLVKRKNPPLGWALPGGFVDYQESLEKAVVREVKEETNLNFEKIKQFRAYSKNKRDPRFHTVSVVFSGKGRGLLAAASDALQAEVFKTEGRKKLKGLPPDIAFDHKDILRDFFASKA